MWAFFLPLLLCKATARLLGIARLTPIKNNTAMGSSYKWELWTKYCSWKWSHQHLNTAMETAVQEKLKPMGISSAQTELHMWRFIPILGPAEKVFTHQACVGKICLVVGLSRATPSLVLHMEILGNTEDINKDRVQVLSKEATLCFFSKDPQI